MNGRGDALSVKWNCETDACVEKIRCGSLSRNFVCVVYAILEFGIKPLIALWSPPVSSRVIVMAITSPYPVQLLIKNTFLHFNIDRFDVKARTRSASAPPQTLFSEKTGVSSSHAPVADKSALLTQGHTAAKQKKRKRDVPSAPKAHGRTEALRAGRGASLSVGPMKIDENAVLDEFVHLARAESWGVFGKRLIERQERVEERWEQLKCKLLQAAPIKKKKRFTLTRRLFLNAAPWVDPAEMLRARRNGFLRPIEPDSMEFWASDADLISNALAPIHSVFVQFRNLVERGQMMMMLPCGTTFVYNYRRDLHLDDLRAKVKDTSSQPYDKKRLICQGQELKGSRVLGDFDVHPGDVISVLFR